MMRQIFELFGVVVEVGFEIVACFVFVVVVGFGGFDELGVGGGERLKLGLGLGEVGVDAFSVFRFGTVAPYVPWLATVEAGFRFGVECREVKAGVDAWCRA